MIVPHCFRRQAIAASLLEPQPAMCQQRDVTYYIDVVYSMHGSDVQPTGTQRECASDLRTNLA